MNPDDDFTFFQDFPVAIFIFAMWAIGGVAVAGFL